jgi:glutathione synthase/RimK-type ligase-like ATP-grasp enzyme
MRQKPVIPLPWWSPLQHDAARFAQSEWRAVIQTLEDYLPSACWINSPEAQRRISYKPRQLSLAASVGFKIPETTITNDPQAVSAVVQRYGKAIYKNFSGYIFTDQTGILTTLITPEMLTTNLESIRRAPGIYQQFIEKKSEARVTVVGDYYFTAFIRTPKTGPGSVDWRHSQFEDIFEEGELPADVASCIKRFQEAAGIRYGAYDFIISPDGAWYFLECNPAGQFLWLEHALGYGISRALAEELSGEKKELIEIPG